MTRYEQLVDRVCESGVVYMVTESVDLPAQSIRVGSTCGIIINNAVHDNDAERTVSLAHEWAHLETGALYNANTPKVEKIRCEGQAWRRTIQELLPFDDVFVEALKGCAYYDSNGLCYDVFGFAESMGVTPEFAEMAIEHYCDA